MLQPEDGGPWDDTGTVGDVWKQTDRRRRQDDVVGSWSWHFFLLSAAEWTSRSSITSSSLRFCLLLFLLRVYDWTCLLLRGFWLVLSLFTLFLQHLCRSSGLRLWQPAVDGHGLRSRERRWVWRNVQTGVELPRTGLKWERAAGTATCVTMLLMSPVWEGRRMVLDSLASLEKADTYCSATLREAAASPFCSMPKIDNY